MAMVTVSDKMALRAVDEYEDRLVVRSNAWFRADIVTEPYVDVTEKMQEPVPFADDEDIMAVRVSPSELVIIGRGRLAIRLQGFNILLVGNEEEEQDGAST